MKCQLLAFPCGDASVRNEVGSGQSAFCRQHFLMKCVASLAFLKANPSMCCPNKHQGDCNNQANSIRHCRIKKYGKNICGNQKCAKPNGEKLEPDRGVANSVKFVSEMPEQCLHAGELARTAMSAMASCPVSPLSGQMLSEQKGWNEVVSCRRRRQLTKYQITRPKMTNGLSNARIPGTKPHFRKTTATMPSQMP